MKKNLRKVLLVLCVLSMIFSLSACGKEVETVGYDPEEVKSVAKTLTDVIASMDAGTIARLQNEYEPADLETSLKYMGLSVDGEAFFAAAESWQNATEELGNVDTQAIRDEDVTIVADEDSVTATVTVTGSGVDSKGQPRVADVEYIFDSRIKLTSGVTNIRRSLAENMQNAGLNTLLGMGTVFVVLILIALVIYCFKYIAVVEKSLKDRKNAPRERAEAVDNALGQIVETEQLSNDTQLIAVIAAAIAAYEEENGGQAGGYVVRSIKRVR